MNRFFVSGLALLAALSPLVAQQTPPPGAPGTPKIEFASTTFDFGKIKHGEVASHAYIFTNTGTADLKIANVQAGCGCTSLSGWDTNVAPGKTGSITLQFNSTGFGGSVAKTAVVTSNDPARTNVVLTISGSIWRPIDVTPQMAMFQFEPQANTNMVRTIKVVSNLDEPLTLSDPTFSGASNFTAVIKEVRPGKEFDVEITAIRPVGVTTALASLMLKTSATSSPIVNVTAYANVAQMVTVTPSQISVPPPPLTNDYTANLTVFFRGTNLLQLSDPKINLPGAKAAIEPMQAGKVYLVKAVIPAGTEFKPNESYLLEVTTDYPDQKKLAVPVRQVPGLAVAARPAGQPFTVTPRQVPVRRVTSGALPPPPVPPGPATPASTASHSATPNP